MACKIRLLPPEALLAVFLVELSSSRRHPSVSHELLGRNTEIGVLLEASQEEIFDNLLDSGASRA